jgi:phosphoglucosamine mutase
MSNLGLYKALDAEGIGYEKTAVGDKYVYECMMENGYILGGEQSGHIIFSKNARTGDGVLTSLKIMEAMVEEKMPLSELTRGLTIYPQLLVNVKVTSKKEVMEDADVLAAAKKVEEALGDDGRILLRQSGTEPLIRVMVEAKTDEICKEHVDAVVDVIRSKGYEVQ